MEWRIILPVLCLIGFLPVPGNAAENNNTSNSTDFVFDIVFHINDTFNDTYFNMNNNDTINLKTKIVSEVKMVFSQLKNFKQFDILQFRNGSIVVDGKLYFNNSDDKPIAANLTQFFNNATFSTIKIITNLTRITDFTTSTTIAPAITANQTTATANQTMATATATTLVPSKLATIQVVFRILQDYKTAYDNFSNPETIELTNNITNAFSPLYRKIFPNFFRMRIRKYSAGSIVADSVLEFDTTNNSSSLNVTETIRVFNDAITSGNLGFKVDNSSINVTDITNSASATTANQTTATANQTTATATATTLVPSKLATIQVVFKIIQDYKTAYDNLSNPETIELTNNITNAFTPIYKKRFSNFFRMRIQKFSAGSIVADSVLEFDTTNNSSSPNVTEVTKVFNEAITTGNLGFKVDNSSINVTDITNSGTTANTSATTQATTTQAATTTAGITLFNLTFKMTDTFINDLSNMSTVAATVLSTKIIVEVEKVFKNIKGYKQSIIRRYRNGSIIVDAEIQYDKASSPTAAQLANALADGVRNGTVGLAIDPKTIVATNVQTGETANKSPVLASVLTAFWMTLASLLLSAVMH